MTEKPKSSKRNHYIGFLCTFVAFVGLVAALYYDKSILAQKYLSAFGGLGCAYFGFMVFMYLENKRKERELMERYKSAYQSYMLRANKGSLVKEKEGNEGIK